MVRLLSVVWYKILPARFGGQKGIAEFNEHLSKYHELTCICSDNNKPTGKESYKIICRLPTSKSQLLNPIAWKNIKKAAAEHAATHLIIEHPYYGLAGIWIKKTNAIKLIVHSHNIEAERFRQMGKWWWKLLYWLEKKTHRNADLSLFKTEDDKAYAIRHFQLDPLKCLVVPFGLNRTTRPSDQEKITARDKIILKHGLPPSQKIILFNGTLDYTPNANAVKIIVRKIIPMLLQKSQQDFTIIVCGRILEKTFSDLKSLTHKNYLYAGDVDDIETYFQAADIFINPVVEGGGIKVKIMEALAFDCTVISTVAGATGIDISSTGNKLILAENDDWEKFTVEIIRNWDRQYHIPQSFFEKYNWDKIVKEVAVAIDRL